MSEFLTKLKEVQTGDNIEMVREQRKLLEVRIISMSKRGAFTLPLTTVYHNTVSQSEFHAVSEAAMQLVTETKGLTMKIDVNGFVSHIHWHNVFGKDAHR